MTVWIAVPAVRTRRLLGVAAPAATSVTRIIRARVSDELLDELKSIGCEILCAIPRYDYIKAKVPEPMISDIRRMKGVLDVASLPISFGSKANTSSGDISHRAASARTSFGVDGTGIKVGVMSDSVKYLENVQSSGDLPNVTVLTGANSVDDGEGTAMLEIVHDLAPGATFTVLGGTDLSFAAVWQPDYASALDCKDTGLAFLSGDDAAAYLLDCAPDEIAAESANFKVTSISVDGEGNLTLSPADGSAYGNGKVEVRYSTELSGTYTTAKPSENNCFMRLFLVK